MFLWLSFILIQKYSTTKTSLKILSQVEAQVSCASLDHISQLAVVNECNCLNANKTFLQKKACFSRKHCSFKKERGF